MFSETEHHIDLGSFKKYALSEGRGRWYFKKYRDHSKTYKVSKRVIQEVIYAYDFLKSHLHIVSSYFFIFYIISGERKLYDSANRFLSKSYTLIVIQVLNLCF